jgi:hypothetical protein
MLSVSQTYFLDNVQILQAVTVNYRTPIEDVLFFPLQSDKFLFWTEMNLWLKFCWNSILKLMKYNCPLSLLKVLYGLFSTPCHQHPKAHSILFYGIKRYIFQDLFMHFSFCDVWVLYDVWVLHHRSMDTKSTQYFNQ